MELNEYQDRAMDTCMVSSSNWTYMSNGLVEEVGELIGKVSKAVRKGKVEINENDIHFKGDTREFQEFNDSLKKELGDCLWMLAGIADVMGWSLDGVAVANLEKLASRKQRGVIDGNGDNR